MCYAAAIPFLAWALLLLAGLDEDSSRVPFLLVEAVAVAVSVHGLHRRGRV
jgi:hypothetical protein